MNMTILFFVLAATSIAEKGAEYALLHYFAPSA